ncbi:hypothetical protein WKW80_32480 [Variovorax humicola]|uniref:Lipid A biosynthesis N-terminal domain-containing protein n=1 Tax=Variovorax humicola TaxID=1769758 RepID=A0ABU8W9R9_9BURK
MSLIAIFAFVLLLGLSQMVSQSIRAAYRGDPFAGWCWGVVVQYMICVALLVFIDGSSFRQAINSAGALTWFVRLFFLMKAL